MYWPTPAIHLPRNGVGYIPIGGQQLFDSDVLEAEFRNGVHSIPIRGQHSFSTWMDHETICNPAGEKPKY